MVSAGVNFGRRSRGGDRRAQAGTERRHSRAQLPGARAPGHRRLRGRLVRAELSGRANRCRRHSFLRGPFHGGDRENHQSVEARAAAGSRCRLFALGILSAGQTQGVSRGARGQKLLRHRLHQLQRGRERRSPTSSAPAATRRKSCGARRPIETSSSFPTRIWARGSSSGPGARWISGRGIVTSTSNSPRAASIGSARNIRTRRWWRIPNALTRCACWRMRFARRKRWWRSAGNRPRKKSSS